MRVRMLAADAGHAHRNRILGALPPDELARLEPHFTPVTISPGQVVQQVGAAVEHVYFIETGMVSFVSVLDEGEMFEVAPVGSFGMTGLGAMRLDGRAVFRVLGQIEAEAVRVPSSAFCDAFSRGPVLQEAAMRQRDLGYQVAARSAACMAHHGLRARLARWLLQVSDIIGSTEFTMTQERIGRMLAVSRPSLSTAAHCLSDAGVIRFRRGAIDLVDRGALEAAACRCYWAVRAVYEPLMAARD